MTTIAFARTQAVSIPQDKDGMQEKPR